MKRVIQRDDDEIFHAQLFYAVHKLEDPGRRAVRHRGEHLPVDRDASQHVAQSLVPGAVHRPFRIGRVRDEIERTRA